MGVSRDSLDGEILPPKLPRSSRTRKRMNKFQIVRRRRRWIDELADDPQSPLRVMLRNMRHWDQQAEQLTVLLEKRLADPTPLDAEAWNEVKQMLAKMLEARKEAQSCAVDAAPYVHPKMASIEIKKEQSEEVYDVTPQLNGRLPVGASLVVDVKPEEDVADTSAD